MTRPFRPHWVGAAIFLAVPAQSAPASQVAAPPGASSCSGCHALRPGESLAVPPLAGRPAADIMDSMTTFRAGERPATIMTRIARGFTPEETRAIAEWLERQR